NDLRSRAKARIFKTGLDNEASIDFPFFMGILWIEMTGADGI
ncbi:12194_t:CDS:1, partial [Gigaspora rosea]